MSELNSQNILHSEVSDDNLKSSHICKSFFYKGKSGYQNKLKNIYSQV